MARFNGATVFLIIIATVSVYSCAIIAGAALGRTLDSSATTKQTPSDRTLRVSVSFRGLAKDFAKEFWGGNHREGRSGRALAGAGDGTAVLSSSPASVSLSPRANRAAAADRESALQPMPVANYTQVNSRVRDDVHTRAAARPWSRHSNFSDEITDEKRPGGRGVIKVGPWGGSGGAPFYMRGGRGVSAPRVRSVTLQYTDDAIHSFYQSSDEPVVKLTLERAEGGGQSRARLTALDLMRSLAVTEESPPNYAQPESGAGSREFYVPPATHFIATVDDLTDMLDYTSEDIDGVDDDARDEQGQDPPFTGCCTATSTYNVYMVDTPKEDDGEGRKDSVEEKPAEAPPKRRR
ncbi:hypothetical protein TRIUR3_26665 [Triticum urartu]|uniref:Transmembrane protein n=1 Tax=Triticum urartu TaxID=4572 RepID=M8A044_TRIUA|nr:hypothetical protein TRIUR3_26665 [Triticum urartu]